MEKGQKILPGARRGMDFGARPLSEPMISSILSGFVWPSGVRVIAWITDDAQSREILKRAGMSVSEPAPLVLSGARVASSLVLRESLRSGRRVEHRGDVIIVGHVNDGAEVAASGNVTALGRVKGLIHAGYEGDEKAVAVIRSMDALQVRIGGRIGALERDSQWLGRSVIARVEDDRVCIGYWPQLKGEAGESRADIAK
jgi:septum site-determining protein MinC